LWDDRHDTREEAMPFTESVPETSQVRSPWKTVLRTTVQVVPALALLVDPVLDAVANGDGSTLGPWAVGALAVSGAITRVMAVPGVEEFFRRYLPWLAAGATD
jgi:hypothetical protein